MPILAVASSSSASPGGDRATPAVSVYSWCFAVGNRAFVVHGFAKSDRENLRRKELIGVADRWPNEYARRWTAAGLAKPR